MKVTETTSQELVALSLPAYDKAIKDNLLELASQLTVIWDKETQELAAEVMKKLKVVIKNVESSRKEIKGPALEFGKKVDEIAKTYVLELQATYDSLSDQLGKYQLKLEQDALKAVRETGEVGDIDKPEGVSVLRKPVFEITNLKEAFNAMPGLFDIVPSASRINEAIKAGLDKCPGMKISWDTTTSVKA